MNTRRFQRMLRRRAAKRRRSEAWRMLVTWARSVHEGQITLAGWIEMGEHETFRD